MGNIFANDISDRGFISKIYKVTQFDTKMPNDLRKTIDDLGENFN